jgi:hypothetical protein
MRDLSRTGKVPAQASQVRRGSCRNIAAGEAAIEALCITD